MFFEVETQLVEIGVGHPMTKCWLHIFEKVGPSSYDAKNLIQCRPVEMAELLGRHDGHSPGANTRQHQRR